MWHSMPRAEREDAPGAHRQVQLVAVRREGRSSSTRSSYEDTFTKYKAGLSSGDLPDLVQLQDTDQQQMIDTQTVLPASACAKADKYSFADFLPRVLELLHGERARMYAMPFNVSGPVLYYNKKAFPRPASTPRSRRRRSTRCAPRREKLKAAGGADGRPRPQGRPGYLEQWTAMARQALREQQQRAQGARDEDGVRLRHRASRSSPGCRAW